LGQEEKDINRGAGTIAKNNHDNPAINEKISMPPKRAEDLLRNNFNTDEFRKCIARSPGKQPATPCSSRKVFDTVEGGDSEGLPET